MGGKNPVIVLNDADLDKAVELTIAGAMLSTGQKCTATSRVIVHKDVLDGFRDRLAARAASLKVGDGMKADTYMGPLVSADAEKTVLEYIETASARGRASSPAGPSSRARSTRRATSWPPPSSTACGPT
jgi:aldehyde dehydrogenase (NAD+)